MSKRLQNLIQKRDRSQGLPVSPFQDRWIIVHQKFPLFTNSNLSICQLNGPLDLRFFRKALNLVIERQEILRTHIAFRGNLAQQEVQPIIESGLTVEDLQEFDVPTQDSAFNKIVDDELSKVFDLRRSPLWSLRLIRFRPEDNRLLVNFSNILCDYWSKGIFFHELMSFYGAIAENKSSDLAPLVFQYPEFGVWHRESFSGDLCKKIKYWEKKIEGTPVLHFNYPKEFIRLDPPPGSFHYWKIPSLIMEELKKICKAEQLSLFSVLQAAFCKLWIEHTKARDFLYGVFVSSFRDQPEFKNLMGPSSMVVPIRLNVARLKNFRDLVVAVRVANLGAVKNALPQTILSNQLRRPVRAPLILFNFLQTPYGTSFRGGGLEMKWDFKRPHASTPVMVGDIATQFQELESGELAACMLFNTRSFIKKEILVKVSEEWLRLLTSLADEPSKILSELL